MGLIVHFYLAINGEITGAKCGHSGAIKKIQNVIVE
jgi:hypothetical protein